MMFALLMTKTMTMVMAMVTMIQPLINKFQTTTPNDTNTPKFGDTHKVETCSAGGANQNANHNLMDLPKTFNERDWRKHVAHCGATVAESETKTESETKRSLDSCHIMTRRRCHGFP